MMSSMTLQGQAELNDSSRAIRWIEILMRTQGLWPLEPNNFLFYMNFGFMSYCMFLEYLDLFMFIENFERVLINLTENLAFTQIIQRMYKLREYNKKIRDILVEVNKDFDAKDYTDEERKIFIPYHHKSRFIMKLFIINTAFTATSYYLTPLLSQMNAVVEHVVSAGDNSSLVFVQPYRFYTFVDVRNASTYFWIYVSQMPFVYVSFFGECSADCLLVALVYHISGQTAILAHRITNLTYDASHGSAKLNRIIESHIRLLRMGKLLEETYSDILLVHLVFATTLVCILGYQILLSVAIGETANLISLLGFIALVLLIVFCISLIGEDLLIESNRVTEAYYNCKWYEMSNENTRTITMCIHRSQDSMRLTAGKFETYCLQTFTASVKTSMGYLSVLRTVMYN